MEKFTYLPYRLAKDKDKDLFYKFINGYTPVKVAKHKDLFYKFIKSHTPVESVKYKDKYFL